MKLNPIAVKILNARIVDEQYARYFYESAAAWCRKNGFDNAEKYFTQEAESENEHRKKITDHLSDWSETIDYKAIQKPFFEFTGIKDILSKTLDIESGLLEVYEADAKEVFPACQATYKLIQEFIQIQNDSVIEANNLLNKFNNYGESLVALFEEEAFKN